MQITNKNLHKLHNIQIWTFKSMKTSGTTQGILIKFKTNKGKVRNLIWPAFYDP